MVELSERAWDGRAPEDVPSWRQMRTDRFLSVAASTRPDHEAIRSQGRSFTYAELDALANRAGNGLLAMGVRPGDVVGVVAENDIEVFGLLYGIARAGFSVLPMNPKYTAKEIDYQVRDAGAKVLIAPGAVDMADVFAKGHDAPPDVEWSEDSFFAQRFTSGTTGNPKQVATTQRAIGYMHFATARELNYGPTDVALVMAPVAHAAFHIAAATVVAGGTIALERGFDPARVWEICDEHQVTHTYLAPTMFALAMNSPGSGASIRGFLAMSAVFPLSLKEKVWARFPDAALYDCYGATELGLTTLLRPTDPLEKQGSVGLPAFGYEVRILDPDGRDVAPGTIGEIYARGPGMSFGYVGAEQMKPGQARDGWLTAGDMGWRDEDGYLFIADRRDDLIVSGGMNVYPAEVEEILLRVDGVVEAAVIGVPDETWGHLVVAAIVGHAAEDDLDRHCRETMARYKVPRRYVFVEALPKNLNGKTLRRVLREQLSEPII